jgi:hypothetical protein
LEMFGYDIDDDFIAALDGYYAEKEVPTALVPFAGQNNQVGQTPPAQEEQAVNPEQQPPATDATATRSALFNWKRASLAAVKTGHSANVDFDHPAIDAETCEFIRYELEAAKTAADVHGIFKQAREMTDKPDPLLLLAAELREARLALKEASE